MLFGERMLFLLTLGGRCDAFWGEGVALLTFRGCCDAFWGEDVVFAVFCGCFHRQIKVFAFLFVAKSD